MIALASYKLRFFDRHVRALPARDESGAPFGGPGVDVRGEEADAILAAAAGVRAWLEAREPGVVLRSLSVDRSKPRVLVTLETGARPRALRFDSPFAEELLAAAAPVEALASEACVRALRQRARVNATLVPR